MILWIIRLTMLVHEPLQVCFLSCRVEQLKRPISKAVCGTFRERACSILLVFFPLRFRHCWIPGGHFYCLDDWVDFDAWSVVDVILEVL